MINIIRIKINISIISILLFLLFLLLLLLLLRAWLRFVATGRARALRPQVSRGRAAQTRRNGLRKAADLTTRRWSTPPAPSTSSAATAAASTPTSSMPCGRAPTEVRCRTRSRAGVGGGVVGYSRPSILGGTTGGTRGGTRGFCRGTAGVLQGYYRGTTGVLQGN
jgi:hypothetical protein